MIKLNLGCGDKYEEGWVNCDLYANRVDKRFDLNKFPYPFKSNSIDIIMMLHTLEHCKQPIKVVDEMIRISKDTGTLIIETPFYNHSGAYEAMHTTFFSDNYFNYWYKPVKSYHKNYPRKGLLELIQLKQTPTILGKLIPHNGIRLALTKALNIPLIFSLTFILKVNKC